MPSIPVRVFVNRGGTPIANVIGMLTFGDKVPLTFSTIEGENIENGDNILVRGKAYIAQDFKEVSKDLFAEFPIHQFELIAL